MRVNKDVWNAAVKNRPPLITQYRMYFGGSDRECANKLLEHGGRYGFVMGRNTLRGKTLASWSSPSKRVATPFWAGLTASHYILKSGFAGNEEVLKSAIAHLLKHYADMSAFEKECADVIEHININWLVYFLDEAVEKSVPEGLSQNRIL